MSIWNRKQGRFAEMCKDLDDEIIYLDDFDEDAKEIESESETEQKELSIVLSK